MLATVKGPIVEQILPYFEDYMTQIYEQNCGSYTLEITPINPFHTWTKTGFGGPHSHPYVDKMFLQTNDDADIGLYPVELKIK